MVRKSNCFELLINLLITYITPHTKRPEYETTAHRAESIVPVTFTGSLDHMQISQLTSLILWNQSNGPSLSSQFSCRYNKLIILLLFPDYVLGPI